MGFSIKNHLYHLVWSIPMSGNPHLMCKTAWLVGYVTRLHFPWTWEHTQDLVDGYIPKLCTWTSYRWLQKTFPGWWFGTFFIFPYIRNNHPNWLSYFSEGVQTTNQSQSSTLASCLMTHLEATRNHWPSDEESCWRLGGAASMNISIWGGPARHGGTWWLIPLSKWVTTLVINGISRLNPLITGVITHLLSGMNHQVPPKSSIFMGCSMKSTSELGFHK